ncbi:MAG: class I SAM-dependent methyltransferase [Acidimicrobiales bacterium]
MEGYGAHTYGDRFADVYDDWYGDVTDVAACTRRLADLADAAGGGAVLELGVGSGRLALPLAERGLDVHGIDASAAMLERLRSKPGSAALHLTQGDMAELALPDAPPFAVVFVAFNTFFNLGTAPEQARCLRQVAERLAPDGVFVLEAFVPAAASDVPTGGAVTPRQITADEVVLTVSHHDGPGQTITGQHIHVTEGGIRLRPWHLRYAAPAELDTMAEEAGLQLLWRHADWTGRAFGPDASVHVSGYGRGNVRDVQPPGSAAP